MSEPVTLIDRYKNANPYTDFTHFEGDPARRQKERESFVAGVTYVPSYRYDKLMDTKGDKHRDKKTAIYEAVMELEAAKARPGANQAELEIYAAFHEVRLKKMMLVEAALAVNEASTSAEWETVRRSFNELNREVYGEFDGDAYGSMLATEQARIEAFVPQDEQATRIRDEARLLIGETPAAAPETDLMPPELLGQLQRVIQENHSEVLSAVPDMAPEYYYDAEACAAVVNATLVAGGLAEKGWRAVVDPAKSNPSTNTVKRVIALPGATRRNADELRRLVIHEQEVHARRGENGRESGFGPLQRGTANYADVEEGLGVLLECAVAGSWKNLSFHRARDRYITAGLALGASGTERDARQVYETMWRLLAIRGAKDGVITDSTVESTRQQAYAHVENAFRGTGFWMRGVVFTKLKVYYEGLRKNAGYFARHADDLKGALETAMLGKYDHTNQQERNDIAAILTVRE